MIPLRDELPSRRFPLATLALVAANVAVFLYQLSLDPARGQRFLFSYGAVPALLTGRGLPGAPLPLPPPLTVITSMFLHGGFLHLAGNMLFLWVFGDNVEDVMGRLRYLVFYLLAGCAAAAAHVAFNPGGAVPMVGASGAISGVLGAYLVLFPGARVVALVPVGFLLQTVRLPALIFLGVWFVMQFLYGALSLGSGGGGVAWFAHVGGFAAGLLLVVPFRRRDRLAWYRRFA